MQGLVHANYFLQKAPDSNFARIFDVFVVNKLANFSAIYSP